MISQFAEQHILVMVEDDDGHATLIQKNLRRSGISNKIVHLRDGAEAIAYFFGQEDTSSLYRKILVLLDLNLPEIDGYEILRRLKEDARTSAIPVIVLTTTDTPKDVDRCYGLGCNAYITKPVEYDRFTDTIQKLGWMLGTVKIPHGYR